MPSSLPKKIFDFDARVRYCGVLDEKGHTISGGMRPGFKSLEPEGEAERVDLQIVLVRAMSESTRQYLGKTNYIVIHRDKLMLIALPRKHKKTLLISAKPDFPLGKLKALVQLVNKN
jgi:hypothetical protein